jgi:hypothetical protein
MPRTVPSQVVSYIDQTFTWLRSASPTSISVNRQHSGETAGLLRLIDEIPGELLVLEGREYTEFVSCVESVRNVIAIWQNQQNTNILHELPASFRGLNPITLIRLALAKCPDEAPAQSTSELVFIADPELRASLRNDMGAISRALSNGEWKAATVLGGSAVEALLLWAIQTRPSSAVTTAVSSLRAKGTFPAKQAVSAVENWHLYEYIEVAEELGAIRKETAIQSRLAKDFRNLIHPGRAVRLAQKCDRATAFSVVAAVEHVVRDLSGAVGP